MAHEALISFKLLLQKMENDLGLSDLSDVETKVFWPFQIYVTSLKQQKRKLFCNMTWWRQLDEQLFSEL